MPSARQSESPPSSAFRVFPVSAEQGTEFAFILPQVSFLFSDAGFLMIGSDISSHIAPYTKAMSLRAYRQQTLASNIANADTPYYKARDFDFSSAYAAAIGKKETPPERALPLARTQEGHARAAEKTLPLARTDSRHLSPKDAANGAIPLLYRTEYQSAVDGNTVDLDVERGQFADNSLQYQILAQFLSDRFSGLRSAISGNQG
ncbi:MAG: flagellar basal body rod protein FlgB [Zoogloeaceae bacterium]|nr:flagellar basal body rod protein FlgB [Zoogloeaceae bacterium]